MVKVRGRVNENGKVKVRGRVNTELRRRVSEEELRGRVS